MNIENIVGSTLGIKLINGRIKPKFGIGAFLGLFVIISLLFGAILWFISGLILFNIETIGVSLFGIFILLYVLLISPYTQNSKNYYIEFESENSLNNFKLSYKNKLVKIDYKIGTDGKIAFLNNKNKLSCISYYDGSKINNFTKYKIINYFGKWLNDNNLMSEEITTSFEKL